LTQGLPIVGVQRLSVIDYPGKLCATMFTGGCNFRCPYCYNVDMVMGHEGMEKIPEQEFIELVRGRLGFLDSVCVTGGEPTIHKMLPGFLRRVKEIGALVKLDTNGSRPRMLRTLLDRGLLDYIAMDVKAPLDRYAEVARYRVKGETIARSIQMVRRSGVDHEFRTTVVPGILDGDGLEEIARTLAGSKRYFLQQFRPGRTLCPEFQDVAPYSLEELEGFRDRVAPYFAECRVRL
jgi:pyruvate formate lyase activating enzyme